MGTISTVCENCLCYRPGPRLCGIDMSYRSPSDSCNAFILHQRFDTMAHDPADPSHTTKAFRANPAALATAKREFMATLRDVSQESAAMARRIEDGTLTTAELHATAVELEFLADRCFKASVLLRGMSL